ncbi:hypothetical protein THAOC_06666, partial [Thalassiosira oceanica]
MAHLPVTPQPPPDVLPPPSPDRAAADADAVAYPGPAAERKEHGQLPIPRGRGRGWPGITSPTLVADREKGAAFTAVSPIVGDGVGGGTGQGDGRLVRHQTDGCRSVAVVRHFIHQPSGVNSLSVYGGYKLEHRAIASAGPPRRAPRRPGWVCSLASLALAKRGVERSGAGGRARLIRPVAYLALAAAGYCSLGVPVQRRPSAPSDSPMSGPEPTPFPGILHLVRQNWPPKDGRGGITSGRGNAGEQDEGGDRLDTGWVASVGDGETKWLVQPTVARKTTTKCVTNGQHRNQTKEETGTKWVAHPSLNRSSKDGRPAGEMHTANIITQNVEGYMRVARDPEGDGDFRADHDYTKLEAIVDRMEAKNIGAYCIQETWDYGDEFCKDIGRGYFLWHHNYDERDTREVEGRQVRRGLRRGVAIILNQEFYDAWKEAGSVEPVTSSTRREHGGRVIGITLKFPKIDSRGKKIKDSKGRQGYLNFFLCLNELNPILRDAHRDAEIIMGGDINASIGIRVDADEKVLGPNGMDYRCSTVTSRAREDDVLNLLTQQCMRVQNTYFTHDEYATYFDKCDKLPVMYDIFATSQSFHKRVRDCKVVDSGIESDHDAVMISITITTIKYKVKAVTGAQSHGGDYSKTHRTNKCSTDLARKTTTKCATNGQHRNQIKEEAGTKWVVHPSLNRSSKDGRPASGTDLAIENKCPGIGAQTGDGRQQKAPPRSHDENGTNCLVRHPSPPQSRGGDDAVAWSQLVDFEQPDNSTSFAWSDFQCGPDANALPDVESLFPSKSVQKSKQLDECEPSRDSPLVPHTSHHRVLRKTEATKNPDKRSQHDKDYKHKAGEDPRGSPPDWKKSIPEESVDPISLEPLCELEYPPFAIVADGLPYTPVFPGDWPPADPADETSEEEGRELAILRSQWGEQALPTFKSEESGDYKPLTER